MPILPGSTETVLEDLVYSAYGAMLFPIDPVQALSGFFFADLPAGSNLLKVSKASGWRVINGLNGSRERIRRSKLRLRRGYATEG